MASRKLVLLVDHHPEVREVFQQAVEQMDLDLITAIDGQEGLDGAKEHKPALIVVRRDAPILNAQSVSVLLKQSPATEKIPVVVLCSGMTEEDKELFKDAGCDDCLKEPLEKEKIMLKLKEWLD